MAPLFLPGMETEARDHDLSQWFTPPKLADQLWAWWLARYDGPRALRVLEPAAGRGALIKPALASGAVGSALLIDIAGPCVEHLRELIPAYPHVDLRVTKADFLDFAETWGEREVVYPRPYDLVLMNPPYEEGLDVDFIRRSFLFAPQCIGIFRSAILHGDERFSTLWRWTDIIRGAWLTLRPKFGKGEKSDSALSDFVVLQLCDRPKERKRGEPFYFEMEWW